MTDKSDLIVVNVERPNKAMFKASEDMLDAAQGRTITSSETAIAAGQQLAAVKTIAKELESKRTTITGPLNIALQEVNELFRPAKKWLKEAEILLKSKILEFQNEQERIARERQAEADALARKEREKLEARAGKAEAKGKEEKAAALRQVAEIQVAPIIESAAPKIVGVSTRVTWKAEVVSPRALIGYIAQNPDMMMLVDFNQSFLDSLARLHKDKLDIPGVKAVEEKQLISRSN